MGSLLVSLIVLGHPDFKVTLLKFKFITQGAPCQSFNLNRSVCLGAQMLEEYSIESVRQKTIASEDRHHLLFIQGIQC